MMNWRSAAGVLLAGLLLVAGVGCSGWPPANVTIAVDHPSALADVPLHATIGGLSGGQRVTVEARATDADGRKWMGSAGFRADAHGAPDLATPPPVGGAYRE